MPGSCARPSTAPADRVTVICDRDSCIAVAGVPRRELMDRPVSQELEQLMSGRQVYQHKPGEPALPLCAGQDRPALSTAAPILSGRATCWAASPSWPRTRTWTAPRWNTNWPSPSPPFWDGIWRIKTDPASVIQQMRVLSCVLTCVLSSSVISSDFYISLISAVWLIRYGHLHQVHLERWVKTIPAEAFS